MGGVCSSSDENSPNSPHRRGGGKNSKNPLSGKTRMKNSDSLSSIELDADDENELALENHKAIDDHHKAWKNQNAGVGLHSQKNNNNNKSSPSSPGITTSNPASPDSSSGQQQGSFGSTSSFRSSGTGSSLMVGGDLGKQREEASVDLVDEFFVWDDMKYDLRKDREAKENPNSSNSNNQSNGGAGSNPAGRKNRKNIVGTGETEGKKTSASGNKGGGGTHFVFNDFAVDEFDFEDDDDFDPDKHDGLSFFSAAAVALTSSGGLNNNNNNNQNSSSSASPGRLLQQDQKEHSGKFSLDDVTTKNGNHHITSQRRTSLGAVPSPSKSNNGDGGEAASNNNNTFTTNSPKNTSKSEGTGSSPLSPRFNKNNNDDNNNNNFSPPPFQQLRTLGGESDEIRNVGFTTLAGHTTRVKVLAVAPGEKEYVSCSSDDFNLTYADLATGKELGAFIGHTENVLHATFSSCGKYLSSTSRDNTMILWDVVTQKAMLTFEHAKVVICSVFSRDSRFIATGCQDKVCRLWEARRGRELGSFAQHEGIIIAMAFAPDNTFVVSASSDRTLRKWSGVPSKEQAVAALAAKAKGEKVPPPQVGKPLGVMLGHEGIILSCTFSSDGKYIISNDERLVKIWNADTCVCHRTFHVDKTVPLRNLPDNKKLTWTLAAAAPGAFPKHFMVAANNRFLYVFNIENEKEEVNLYCKSPIYCLTAGQRATALCGDAFGNVYCMKLGNPYLTLEPPSASRPPTPAGGMKGGDFS